MNINRRAFFSLLLAQPAQATSLRVAVLETFDIGESSAAVLVHHAEVATRDVFAHWLQSHPKSAVRVRGKTGEEVAGTVFRVRMCFGRGLILLQRPIQVRERDVLTITG